MTRDEIIARFAPTADPNFSPEELEVLHKLNDEEINALAEAYPNQPTRKSYVRLFDTNVKADKQIFQPTTWQNLRNLRKFSNQKHLIPWDFVTTVQARRIAARPVNTPKAQPKRVVVDMSAQEAAEELRKSLKPKEKKEEPKNIKKTVEQIKPVKKEAPKPAKNIPADQEFPSVE